MTDSCHERSAAPSRLRAIGWQPNSCFGCPAGSTGSGRNPPPVLPLAAEAGEAAGALQAVALQEALHRGRVERQASAASASRSFRTEIVGRASRMRKMHSRSGSIREALPPIGSGRTWPRSRKRCTQRRTLDAPGPKCRAAALQSRSTTAATATARRSTPTGRPCLNSSSPLAGPSFVPPVDSFVVVPPAAPALATVNSRACAASVNDRVAAAATPNPNAAFRPVRRRAAGPIRPSSAPPPRRRGLRSAEPECGVRPVRRRSRTPQSAARAHFACVPPKGPSARIRQGVTGAGPCARRSGPPDCQVQVIPSPGPPRKVIRNKYRTLMTEVKPRTRPALTRRPDPALADRPRGRSAARSPPRGGWPPAAAEPVRQLPEGRQLRRARLFIDEQRPERSCERVRAAVPLN